MLSKNCWPPANKPTRPQSFRFGRSSLLYFAGLICFDVYVQKIENYYNNISKGNRKKYRQLANRNIQLKPLTFGEDNILMNIGSNIEKAKTENEEQNKNDEIKKSDSKNLSKSLYPFLLAQ